jgi:hypothetical protein
VGKYYDDAYYRDKLPLLHNLLYTSKSTRQGSFDRYKKEECTMSIKKHEFKYYLISKPNHKVGIFIMEKRHHNTDEALMMILSHVRDNQYFVEWKTIITTIIENEVYSFRIQNMPKHNFGFDYFPRQNMHLEDLLASLFKIRNPQQGTTTDMYDNDRYYIRFDVLTTYNILTNRSSCVELVKQYAKNLVSDMVNDDLRKLVFEDNIPAVNLYLYMNASILGIDKNYYPKISAQDNAYIYLEHDIQKYISKTEDERRAILDIIVSQINTFT